MAQNLIPRQRSGAPGRADPMVSHVRMFDVDQLFLASERCALHNPVSKLTDLNDSLTAQ
jgi:hypothetical protein